MPKWRTIILDLSTARTKSPISCYSGGVIVWATSTPDAALSLDFDQDNATLETPAKAGQGWEGSIKTVYVTNAAQPGRTITLAIYGDYGDGTKPVRPRTIAADAGLRRFSDYQWQAGSGFTTSSTEVTLLTVARASTLEALVVSNSSSGSSTSYFFIKRGATTLFSFSSNSNNENDYTAGVKGMRLEAGDLLTSYVSGSGYLRWSTLLKEILP